MRRTKPAQKATAAKADRIQCHFISNTHWDREWKNSMQRTRFQLVQMMDTLLDILAREPKFKSFHLDSQTIPLLDYLEIRPEREPLIRKLAKSGRLVLGPWYTLPDEFCIGGESLIRNLLLGHRIAARFGPVAKTGYSPFSWGQISQMPQIYRGFGIDFIMFYRGVNTIVAPKAEFIWRGPDGSELIASRLGKRPRYNVWYVLQRPAYWGVPLDRLNDFEMKWSSGHGVFHMADERHSELLYSLAHPKHGYDARAMPAAAEQALREQDNDWTTPHRMWSEGHDSSVPDRREVRLVADAAAALREQADVYFSTIAAFQDGLRANRRSDWPVVEGEMRHTYTKGSTSPLIGWVTSARGFLKRDNFATEQVLATAETLATCSGLIGGEYPQAMLAHAWQQLLANHAHDSIGGCGRDVVHEDMLYRSRQAREIATCVIEQACREIAGSIDLRDKRADDMALVVFNPAAQTRSEVVSLGIDVPREWGASGFEIVDDAGAVVPIQPIETHSNFSEAVENPGDVVTYIEVDRHHVRALVRDVPGVGYQTLHVRPVRGRRAVQPRTMLIGPMSMENEHLSVSINSNGTLDVWHKASGRVFDGLGYFRDSGATGNAWQHESPPRDMALTTLNERAAVACIRDGALEASFRVTLNWSLPEALTADRSARSDRMVPFTVVNTVTLRCGQPWVEVVTELVNVARDHYLRVSFPSALKTDVAHVQSHFDVVQRKIETPDHSQFDETPQTEQPMNSFVDMTDGECGLALLSEGMKAYEAHDDAERTLSLTLLRAFQLRFFIPDRHDFEHLSRTAQQPGRHVFRYAIMPHAGDWHAGGVWPAAERFTQPLLAAQIAPTVHGDQPRARASVEVSPGWLHVSAIKRSESGNGWIVRLCNPTGESVSATVRLNGGVASPTNLPSPCERVEHEFALPRPSRKRWSTVREVTLEETPVKTRRMNRDGRVELTIGAKKIVTLEFVA